MQIRAWVIAVVLGWTGAALAEEVDAQAALRAIGPMHVPPIRFAAGQSRPETWLGIVGDATTSRAAFIARIEHGHARTLHVQSWPIGVRVLESKVEDDRAYFLVEPPRVASVPSRDPVFISVGIAYSESPGVDPPHEVHLVAAGIRKLDELGARLAARPGNKDAITDEDVHAAMKTLATAAKAVSPQGLDVFRARQGVWLQSITHVDPGAAAASPWLRRARELALAEGTECGRHDCTGNVMDGMSGFSAQLQWEKAGERWLLRALLDLPDRAVAKRASSPAKAQAARGDGKRTMIAVREQTSVTDAVLLGEAPLSAEGGIIGAVAVHGVPVIVMTMEGVDRVFSIEEDPWAHPLAPAKLEASFVDADGDGRTDVVLWTDGAEHPALPFSAVFFAPTPSIDTVLPQRDLGSELHLMGSKTAEEAAARMLTFDRSGPTPKEVCALFGPRSGRATWKRVATHDAKVLRFSGYLPVTWRPDGVGVGSAATDEDVESFGSRCHRLQCEGPVCYHGIDDARDDRGKPINHWFANWYWFVREGGKWKVAGFAALPNAMMSPRGASSPSRH